MVFVPDSEGRLPLHWALGGVTGSVADKVDSDKITARMKCLTKMLLDVKPDTVYAKDRHSATVFYYLAVNNNTGHGTNVQAIRRNALQNLSSYSWQDSVSPSLIDRSLELLDVTERDDDGRTGLHDLVNNLDYVHAVAIL